MLSMKVEGMYISIMSLTCFFALPEEVWIRFMFPEAF